MLWQSSVLKEQYKGFSGFIESSWLLETWTIWEDLSWDSEWFILYWATVETGLYNVSDSVEEDPTPLVAIEGWILVSGYYILNKNIIMNIIFHFCQ